MDGSVYDVFISFRGKDTRKGFTGSLHIALCAKQIKSFMDDQDLEKGAEINPALEKAIQASRIALVILSKNYASSTFCLDELEKIMNCSQHKGMLVLPVFYEVEPSDVRYQKGKYADSLNKHETRMKEKIEKWRVALKKISYLSGWNSKEFRYEYVLIDNIVEHVIKKIHELHDGEKEIRICIVDEKHVTKPNTVENLVTDPTPRKSLIAEINDMSISGILNYDSRKMIPATVLIQRKFRRWRLYRERQAIKIQAAFRRYQVWKQYRKMIWFGAVGKAILHWRLTTRAFCVLKHGNETEEKLMTSRFCIVDENHVTKPNTVENLVTDPTPQKSLIEEINDMSISGILNYDSRKMIAVAVLIQRKYRRWRLHREHQAIKIQAAFRGYQVRKQYRRKMTKCFCVLRHGNEAGSSRSSLRPGQVPQVASASLCFKAGLDHLELNHLSDALSCFDESFPLLAKK